MPCEEAQGGLIGITNNCDWCAPKSCTASVLTRHLHPGCECYRLDDDDDDDDDDDVHVHCVDMRRAWKPCADTSALVLLPMSV